MMKNKRTDPVTLVFGRPDIGAYLTETFAMETEAHGDREDCGQDTPGPLVSTRDIARVTGQPGRQVRGCGDTHSVVFVCNRPAEFKMIAFA